MLKKCLVSGLAAALFSNHAATASAFSSVYSFTGLSDGGAPTGGVVTDAKGNIYGVTPSGGANGQGTIFELSATGQFITLATFVGGKNGGAPQGALLARGSELFGTASAGGGTGGHGTIFSFNLNSSKLRTLHVFTGSDGATPNGGLWLDASGNLVGTAYGGGADGLGTVYKYNLVSGQFSLIYSFQGGTADGANPDAGVVEDSAGNIYGTTFFGGSFDWGTAYKIAGSSETIIDNVGASGCCSFPVTEPALDSAGNVYVPIRGSEYLGGLDLITPGGAPQYITPLGGPGPNGGLHNPYGDALEGSPLFVRDTLYLTCAVAGGGGGSIVSVSLTNGYPTTVIYGFTGGADGYNPSGKLARTKAGTFFGTTSSGGTYGYGTIFSFTP